MQLVAVTEASELFITIDEDASFESVVYQGFITEKFSDIYVMTAQAKSLCHFTLILLKAKHFIGLFLVIGL